MGAGRGRGSEAVDRAVTPPAPAPQARPRLSLTRRPRPPPVHHGRPLARPGLGAIVEILRPRPQPQVVAAPGVQPGHRQVAAWGGGRLRGRGHGVMSRVMGRDHKAGVKVMEGSGSRKPVRSKVVG